MAQSSPANGAHDPLHNAETLDGISLKSGWDGKASIEHQISIHINDLVDIEGGTDAVTLADTLAGLSYIMEYRIKGKFPHLDLDLMRRVCKALLMNMGNKQGKGFALGGSKGFTPESDMAFLLFAEFFQEVEEFRQAVSEVPETDLRSALHIAERCKSSSSPEQKQSAVALLLLLQTLPQFKDWRELVEDEGLSQVEQVYNQMASSMPIPQLPFSKEELLPPPNLYFDRKVDRLADMFSTDVNNGLSSTVIPELQAHYGTNQLPKPKPPSIWRMIWNQLTDFMVILLIIVVIVELGFQSYPEAIVLAVVVILNVIIGFSQEYKANRAMEALMSLTVPMAVVIRDGQQQKIDAANLVPGDVVILEEGDAVPADLRIVESAQLEIVEAILTGESVPCVKNPKHIRARTRKLPLGDCKGNAFMSTVVAKGRGKGIVVRTGLNTEIGKISAAITSQPHQKTPIQKRLDRLGMWLVVIAVLLCALVVIIGVAWRNPVVEMVEVGISLAVSVIPEGLVAVTTVTMALGVSRMAQQNAIVRKLPSVETLGSVTVICSDKTGTLTEGKMGTAMMWTADGIGYNFTKSTDLDPTVGGVVPAVAEVKSNGVPSGNPLDAVNDGMELPKTLEGCPAHVVLATLVCALCNNSTVALEDGTWKSTGDPTEVALIVAAQKAGFGREWWLGPGGLQKLGEYAFDSERKLMSAVYLPSNASVSALQFSSAIIAAKGAPEALLSRCTSRLPAVSSLGPNATVAQLATSKVPLDEEFVRVVSEKSAEMAGYGLRMLGLAIRSVSPQEADDIVKAERAQLAESDLCFVGLVGLIDPPKAGVKEAVQTCKRAGVKVIMITGDHIATASAIAKQLGILDPNDPSGNRAMKGTDLDLLSEEALGELRPFPSVFARVSPDNKLQIVSALQAKGQFAAMTGDGVNDAPAIKKADVGIAMGQAGTEITKQAADIVLADDNFVTIVEAVREGRRVYDNILKFIVYLLSCNSAEILIMLLSSCINIELPFTTMMILWANIIADVPPAMSLGLEPCEPDVMDRKPRPPDQGVLTFWTGTTILFQGFTMGLIAFAVYLLFYYNVIPWYGDHLDMKRTLAFTTLTTGQLLQALLSRSVFQSVFVMGIWGNKWMLGAIALSLGLEVLGIYTPGLNSFLTLVPLDGLGWAVVIIAFVCQVILVECWKLFMRTMMAKGAMEPRRNTGFFSAV